MDEILCPLLAHEFEHLKNLPEVQVLLICHHIETLIKIIGVFAVDGGSYVARGVERSAVRAQNKAGRHAVLLKVDNLRTVALLEQTLLPELVDDGLHFIGIKPFAGVAVEVHVNALIYLFYILQCELLEPIKQLVGLLIAAFYQAEVLAGFLLHLLIGLVVEAHIEVVYGMDAALFDLLPVAPMLIGADEFAELRAIVAEVIYTYGFIP